VMMLEWLGRQFGDSSATNASRSVAKAVESCMTAGEVTGDIGGKLSTIEMGRAIRMHLQKVTKK
jgi:isocitrate/isopropylmalate dehydrogenase